MPIRNQNWYNLQSTRRYPLDDKTTGDDDNGTPMRDDIIVDCHIRYPETFGQYLFIQGITVTPNIVTLVIGAAETLSSTNCPTVAAITIDKPAAIGVNEPVTAFVPGLSGWITFGPGIETNFVGRYSTPMQSFIGQRNARPYRPLPIPSLGKDTVAEYLQGVVNIVAESPVTATYYPAYTVPKFDPQTDETNSIAVQAIVFSAVAPTAELNPQTFFLAPCSERPESGTCKKKPLERINGVAPDCNNGNINIVFQGGLTGVPFEGCGGIDILTDLGLTLICNRVPDSEKKRKDDCPCENDDGISEYCWPETPTDENNGPTCGPGFNSGEPDPDAFLAGFSCATLPVCVSFNDCVECTTNAPITTTDLEIVSGAFLPTTIAAPPVCCPESVPELSTHGVWLSTNGASMNIALYRTCAGDWAYDKVVSTELKLRTGGLRQNGGLILNYVRVIENERCRTKYFAAIVDATSSELQLYRFDGALLIKEASTPINYTAGTWYKISAVAQGTNGAATITASLHNKLTGNLITTLTTNVTDYEVINGRAGIIANSATTYFNKFEISAP